MEGSLFRALMGLAPRRGRSCVEGTAFASCAARRTRGSSETTTKTPAKAYRSDLWRVMAFARRLVVPARLLFAALRACGTPCDVFAGRYRAWASGGEVRRVSKNLQICKKAKTAACVRSSPCPHGGDHATTSSRAVCSSRVVRPRHAGDARVSLEHHDRHGAGRAARAGGAPEPGHAQGALELPARQAHHAARR